MSPASRRLPIHVRLRHLLIMSQWKRWLLPLLCLIPYLGSLLWLMWRELYWVVQVLLAPIFMAAVLAGLTIWLAQQEFKGPRRSG